MRLSKIYIHPSWDAESSKVKAESSKARKEKG